MNHVSLAVMFFVEVASDRLVDSKAGENLYNSPRRCWMCAISMWWMSN